MNGAEIRRFPKPASGDDVKAVVLDVGASGVILCFLHGLTEAVLGTTTTASTNEDGVNVLRMTRKGDGWAVDVYAHAMLEVRDLSKSPSLQAGDAIVLCGVVAKKTGGRTAYDASWTRMDYSIAGYSERTRRARQIL